MNATNELKQFTHRFGGSGWKLTFTENNEHALINLLDRTLAWWTRETKKRIWKYTHSKPLGPSEPGSPGEPFSPLVPSFPSLPANIKITIIIINSNYIFFNNPTRQLTMASRSIKKITKTTKIMQIPKHLNSKLDYAVCAPHLTICEILSNWAICELNLTHVFFTLPSRSRSRSRTHSPYLPIHQHTRTLKHRNKYVYTCIIWWMCRHKYE